MITCKVCMCLGFPLYPYGNTSAYQDAQPHLESRSEHGSARTADNVIPAMPRHRPRCIWEGSSADKLCCRLCILYYI